MPQRSDPCRDVTPDFRAALAGGPVPGCVTASDPDEIARRFAVYRNNVAHSLREALARRFPAVRRLVGTEFFAAMAAEFIAAHPPRTPVLQDWGDAFATFLDGFPPVATLPYLGDVARIEWARGRAYHAADATALPTDRLTDAEPLRLHPSLRLVPLSHPAVAIWRANQPGRDGKPRAIGPQIALIWRRPDFDVSVEAISPADASLVHALMAGRPLAVAGLLTDPVPMLTLLLRDGLICEHENSPER
ncbi:HvfC/BufC family peptide modification chaperone [Paracoccus salsus]|uniref:HvfC/BufC family peptide modification chaperone n=1 Tax=Paracoccus salsus TaxID=2911061 RepID=UPI001F17E51F|nr:putative DNA-binding domain-containing protein [Paracoccus salsus]MCF3973170.1 putative DNA-binding domain-containing protein [Paracoccus salsus]